MRAGGVEYCSFIHAERFCVLFVWAVLTLLYFFASLLIYPVENRVRFGRITGGAGGGGGRVVPGGWGCLRVGLLARLSVG